MSTRTFNNNSGTGGGKLILDTTSVSLNNATTTPQLAYTEVIPGGTLSTNNSLRVTLIGTTFRFSNSSVTGTIRISYGGTTIGEVSFVSSGTFTYYPLTFSSVIAANNATNAQLATTNGTWIGNADRVTVSHGNASVDSTINQDLEIEFLTSGGSATLFDAKGILIEVIS